MLRRAPEVDDPSHPERVTYVAAIMWPDGELKQGHFQMDRDRYAAKVKEAEEQGLEAPEWERVVLDMLSQLLEKIMTERRNQAASLIVVPGRHQRN